VGDKVAIIKKTWGKIEHRLLNGQKMQGVLTCEEVIECLIFKKIDNDLISEEVSIPSFIYIIMYIFMHIYAL
jgi:DNA/RNA endonuclease G (NUC1)